MATPRAHWKLDRPGARLPVYAYGSDHPAAATIVLVHGFPDDHTVFDPLIDALGPEFRIISYDTRGAAASELPSRRPADVRLPVLAEDLFAVIGSIPDRNGPIHVFGHDWGSVQSWEAMRDPRAVGTPENPGLVASYASMSGPCVDHLREWNRRHLIHPRDWPTIAAQLGRSWYVFAFSLPGSGRLGPRLFRRVYRRELDGREVTADSIRGRLLYRANILQRMTSGPAPGCLVPCTLIVADGDPFLSARLNEEVDTWIPDVTVVTVQGGHWCLIDRAAEVASILCDVWGDSPRRTRLE